MRNSKKPEKKNVKKIDSNEKENVTELESNESASKKPLSPKKPIELAHISEKEKLKIEKKKAKKLRQKSKKTERKQITQEGVNVCGNKIGKTVDILTEPKPEFKLQTIAKKILDKKEKKREVRKQAKEIKNAERSPKNVNDEATIFVGNLPVNTKRVQLIRLFDKYGKIESIRLRSAGGKVLHKHKQRKAAGSLNAYVVFENAICAEKALELNGVEFKSNHLRITKSLKKCLEDRSDEAKRTIFVGNLKYSATEKSLRDIFSSCGEIDYVRCIRDGERGCKGIAYVCFKHSEAIALALELKDTILEERPINVERFSGTKLALKAKEAQVAEYSKNKQSNVVKKVKNEKNNKHTAKRSVMKKESKNEFRGVKVKIGRKRQSRKLKSNISDLAKKIMPKATNQK